MSGPDLHKAPLIQVIGATKTYHAGGQAYPALRKVSLEVTQGEFVAIMGPSGSGKSTLLHLLGGLDNPTSGQVIVAQRPLHALNETQLALFRRKHVGFVFQSFNLIANLSARDNIELPGLLYAHERPAAIARRAGELLEILGIASQARKLPSQLSGGQRQRVAIARALINNPDILLADEPTGNLDSTGNAEVMRLFTQLNQQGQTFLIVSHDPTIASYAHRVVFIRDGQITNETSDMCLPRQDVLADFRANGLRLCEHELSALPPVGGSAD
jgi:putative ABC transport system ATP-binding protein